MRYRRDRTPGGCFFFTAVTHQRRRVFAQTGAVDLLRQVVRQVRGAYPFQIEAWVSLPDHMHAIWTMPEGDADYSVRWSLIKSGFSRGFHFSGEPCQTSSRLSKGERSIWQRRFWEHRLRDEEDFARHFDYIHFNPVKHGLVSEVWEWPHSTFHHHARIGTYPAAWAGGRDPSALETVVGE
jgi:putative transposase